MGVTDNFDNLMGLHDVFGAVYAASNGVISILFLVIVFVVAFVGLKRYSTNVAFLGSSTITALSSVMLWGGGLLQGQYVIITVIMLAAAVLMHTLNK